MTAALERSYALAERVTARWARSFYFASRFLPPPKRRAVFALYDFCRHADNLVDLRGARPAEHVRAELAALEAVVRSLHAGCPAGGERWLALADTLRRYPVPLEPLVELLDGVSRDLAPQSFPDYPALQEYCRLVAGGVGLMLGPVLGAEPAGFERLGVQLGVAMQLTNILRDIAEDLDAGRIYLPSDEMALFGVTAADLAARRSSPRLEGLIQFQLGRARALFDAADPVVERFPADGSRLTVRLLQRTYAGILDGIARQGYDPFRGRAYVSGPRKLLILGSALIREYLRPAPSLTEQSA